MPSASEKSTRQQLVSGSQPGRARPPMATRRCCQAQATRRAQKASSMRSFAFLVTMRTRILLFCEMRPAPCQVPFSSKTSTTPPLEMAVPSAAGSMRTTSPSKTHGWPALSERAAFLVTTTWGYGRACFTMRLLWAL